MKRLVTLVLFAVLLLGVIAMLPATRSAFAAPAPTTQAHPCGHSHCDNHECKSDCSSSSCPCH